MKTFPWIALALLLLAFGTLAPGLGFYFDDWPVIVNLYQRSIGTFWQFHYSDRPVAAWTYIVSGPLLGTSPLAWQFFSIAMRWLTVLGLGWLLSALWPARQRQAVWMALLFAVYPAFDQQAISVAYSQHWMVYAVFFLSIASMLQAERDPRRFWLWTGLALAAQALHIFSMEYFVGLEMLRPLLLWIAAGEAHPRQPGRMRYSFKRWLPYAAVLVVYIAWRIFIYPQGREDPNHPRLLYELLTQPLATVVSLAQYAVQDFLNILVGSWYKTLDPTTYLIADRMVLLSLGVALVGGLLAYAYLRRSDRENEEEPSQGESSRGLRQAFILGFLAVILGALPVWLTGRHTAWGLYGSRFALASMFGASLLTVAVLEWLAGRRTGRLVVLCVLIALAIGFHIRRVEVFRWSWEKQTRFYWQLYWRAPDLKNGAVIGSDGEIFTYVGRSATTLTLNLIYPEDLPYPQIGHMFYELPQKVLRRPAEFLRGDPLDWEFRNFHFIGSTRDTVLIYYEPDAGACLWVLNPRSGDDPMLPDLTRGGLGISNLEMIQDQPGPSNGLPASIFGPEPQHNWCYYFQKADLARQFGDWEQVAALGDQALEEGHSPNQPREWLPFIEGFARMGRWQEAIEKSLHVSKVKSQMNPQLCQLWDEVASDLPVPDDLQAEHRAMRVRLECAASP